MIRIHLSVDDLARMRIIPSALWETVCSSGVLMGSLQQSVHALWALRARRGLRGVDLSPLRVAVENMGNGEPGRFAPLADACPFGGGDAKP